MNSYEPHLRHGRRRAAPVNSHLAIGPQLVVGALMVAAGIIVLVTGTNASHGTPFSGTLFDRFSYAITWYICGGIVTGMVGLTLMLVSLPSART